MAIATGHSWTVAGNWAIATILIVRQAIANRMTGREQTTVTVSKTTHKAMKAIAEEYGFDSLHALVASCCLARDTEGKLPKGTREALNEVAG